MSLAVVVPIAVIILGVGLWAFRRAYRGRAARQRCRLAMAAVSQRYGLDWSGGEDGCGSASGQVRGRSVRISPAGDGIEINYDERGFHLSCFADQYTRPPQDYVRFDSGNARFDAFFPIRYAAPRLAASIEASRAPLKPLLWFLERWEGRLGRVVVTWSDIEVHVVEGGPPDSDVGYIRGDDLEKLLLDAVVLAEGLDTVARDETWQAPDLTDRQYAPLDEAKRLLPRESRTVSLTKVAMGALFASLFVLPVVSAFKDGNPFATGGATGELVGGGPLVGEFTLKPDKCRSGDPFGFYGVYLGQSGSGDARVKVFEDQIHGKKVVVQVPGSCDGPRCKHMILGAENCPQFAVRWDRTNTTVNRVRVLEGEMRLDCRLASNDWVRGQLTFGGCH